jgi:hypothetical protein
LKERQKDTVSPLKNKEDELDIHCVRLFSKNLSAKENCRKSEIFIKAALQRKEH